MNLEFYRKLNGALIGAIRLICCIALFSFLSTRGFGQNEVKSDSILLNEIDNAYENEEYREAIQTINSGANQFLRNENWHAIVACQRVIYDIGIDLNKPRQYLAELEKNHSLIPDSLDDVKAQSTYYLASLEEYAGNTIRALNLYLSTISPFLQNNNINYLRAVYNDLGIIYTTIGDYSTARKHYHSSKEINLELNNIDRYSYNIYNLAENHFYSENYEESEKFYKEFIKLQMDYKAEFYSALSSLRIIQNQLDSARIYYQLANTFNIENYVSQNSMNNLYADILCQEGNFGEAINVLKKNETEVLDSEDKRDKGKYFYKLADLYSKNRNWETALSNYDKSLKSFTDHEISIDSLRNFSEKEFLFNEIWIGDVLVGLSKVYNAKFIENKKEENKNKAKECMHYALQALDYKRSFFEDIESSIFANRKSKALYETAIDIYLEWYEENEEEEYLNSAFEIAQRHNAFILRQEVNERVILDKYSVDEELKKQYLDQKLIVLETSYILGNDYSQNGFEKLEDEEFKLDSLIKILNEKYPLFEQSKNDFTVTSMKEIQKHLDKKSAVIKYFEGSEKLYSFVITKKKLSYFIHENVEEVKDQASQVRSILSNFKYTFSDVDSIEKKYQEISFALFENILSQELESLPKSIKSLTIIPTGSLTQIPFESFVIQKKGSWKDPNQYVMSKYAISYNYFCKALISSTVQKELDDVLAYGLEYDEYTLNASKKFSNDGIAEQIIEKFRSEKMGHLYFADDEAKEVAEMFDGVAFINKNATKENFLSHVLDYDIVHLSAHSFVDFQYPSNSSIIFTKKDSLTDNLLRIKDVDRLTLNGQLFTLSACNTFFGKQNEGEGLSSMARSFIQSGAGSVIGSFWSVPDEISKSFMVRFYSKLKEGMPKNEALQATKIDFMTDDNLSSPLYRSPAYWSAWVIYGDTSSIKKTVNWKAYLGIGVLFLGILFLIKYREEIQYRVT